MIVNVNGNINKYYVQMLCMIFFPVGLERHTFPFLFIIMQIPFLYKTFEENLSILYR